MLRNFKIDNAPIGLIHICSWEKRSSTNPAGYVWDPALDISSAAGRVDFSNRLFKWALDAMEALNSMRAKRMICWAPEGVQYVNYQGAPDAAYSLNGDWIRPILREFFSMFRRAGYQTGCCVRHQELADLRNDPTQLKQPPSAFEVMYRKILWAYQEWGCRVFYFDSNVIAPGGKYCAIDAENFRFLHHAFPDCLLIPEHKIIYGTYNEKAELVHPDWLGKYHLNSAPYQDSRFEGMKPAPEVLATVPNAVCAAKVFDASKVAEMTDAMREGNILMCDAWMGSDVAAAVGQVATSLNK